MKRLLARLGWVVVIAALVVAAYVYDRTRRVPVEMGTVSRGPIEEYVTEEARTQLETERVIAAERAGTVERIELEEGDTVSAGQTVTSVEATELELSLGILQDELAEIQARLSGADVPLPKPAEVETADKKREQAALKLAGTTQQMNAARAELEFAQRQFTRIEGLKESGSASEEQFDAARRRLEVARAELKAAEHELEAARVAVRIAELGRKVLDQSMQDTAHLHQLYRAQQERVSKMLRLTVQESHIESPIDGTVLEKLIDSQQYVQPGMSLLRVGDMSSIEVRADILSDEVGRVRVGQRVLLAGRALPETPPVGRVKRIFPSGFTKISSLGVREQRVPVLIEFDNSDLGLQPGYELDVKIVVASEEDVVLVPSEAVFATEEGMGAFVVEAGKARLRQVETGLTGEDCYQVTAGLQPGEVVVLRPPTELEDGRRVKKATD
jgi:HlyD family secretion protein